MIRNTLTMSCAAQNELNNMVATGGLLRQLDISTTAPCHMHEHSGDQRGQAGQRWEVTHRCPSALQRCRQTNDMITDYCHEPSSPGLPCWQ